MKRKPKSNEQIRSRMIDAGVSWAWDHKSQIEVIATGADRSGAVVIHRIPDDIVVERAMQVLAKVVIWGLDQ